MEDSIIDENKVPFSVRYDSEIFVVLCTIGVMVLALGMIFVVMPIVNDTVGDIIIFGTHNSTEYTYIIDNNGLTHIYKNGEPTWDCILVVPALKYIINVECK